MTYNGWKNYDTWNVSLWISNDYVLYQVAREYMQAYKGNNPYNDYIKYAGLDLLSTPDGARWLSSKLDYSALNEMMEELRS